MSGTRKGMSRLVKLLLFLFALLPVWYVLWERQHQAPSTGQAPVLQERCAACGLQVSSGPKEKPADVCPRCGREGTVRLVLADPDARPMADTDFFVRIGVGIVAFLALLALVIRGDRRAKAPASRDPESWVACPSCGRFVRAKLEEEENVPTSCPECGEAVSSSAPGVIAEAAEDQEVNAYMRALVRARQDRRRKK
jgi:predicted RNA-binding Zn-ribbon protein involved in translation (DUF1610 family)